MARPLLQLLDGVSSFVEGQGIKGPGTARNKPRSLEARGAGAVIRMSLCHNGLIIARPQRSIKSYVVLGCGT